MTWRRNWAFLEVVYNVTEGVLGPKLENVEKHLDTLEEKVQEVYD